jgi:hypothetical protein
MFRLSSYVACHHFGVVLQSNAKDQFYDSIKYVSLNSNCVYTQKFEKTVEDRLRSQNKLMGNFECKFFTFSGEILVKSQII